MNPELQAELQYNPSMRKRYKKTNSSDLLKQKVYLTQTLNENALKDILKAKCMIFSVFF